MNRPYRPSITKVIPLKVFLDIVDSSLTDITRALRGCFCEGYVYMYVVSFRFVSKQRKTSNVVGMSSLMILVTTKGAPALGVL